MMAARTAVCVGSHSKLLKACLISTRYSLVRKQFKDTEGKEIPIFNY